MAMKLERVAVLGGGPGGLYAARLIKRSHPSAEVTVYEQGVPDKTFGFGVGLASRTQRNLHAADPDTLDALTGVAHPHEMSMQIGSQVARLPETNLLAIARTELLAVLQRYSEDAGVRLRFGARRTAAELDADLIIAADGINSATRDSMAAEFGPTTDTGAGLYLWCGTDFALPSAIFAPVTTEHGTFVAHAYPYAKDRSTFLIETDETTWRNAGFDQTTELTPPNESDQRSLDYLQDAFAEQLEGHSLIGNRTRWLQFRTVSATTWHSKNVVLLGDAAHTAHYSIGSGTKLAMEDAIVLDEALRTAATLDDALTTYEEIRRPAVEHLQHTARRSELWWESFPQRMHLPVAQLVLAYMTRAGKVSLDRFAETAITLARQGLADYAGLPLAQVPSQNYSEWTLAQPLTHDHRSFSRRIAEASLRDDPSTTVLDIDLADAWNAEADALVRHLAGTHPSTASTLWLTGAPDREALLTRLDFAERLHRETEGVVVVESSESYLPDLVAGLATARTHLIALTDSAAHAATSLLDQAASA